MNKMSDGAAKTVLRIQNQKINALNRKGRGRLWSIIRAMCNECCGGQWSEVEKCTGTICALYPVRFGKWPEDVEWDLWADRLRADIKEVENGSGR